MVLIDTPDGSQKKEEREKFEIPGHAIAGIICMIVFGTLMVVFMR